MKKHIVLLCLGLFSIGLYAQNDQGAKVAPVSQAIQNSGYTIQVGLPFLGQDTSSGVRNTTPADVRFPWDVLYLFNTFSEESFDVSKGYFGDKVLISWTLRSNLDLISTIVIYRREYTDDGSNEFLAISSIAPDQTTYEDKYVEGGVLYEYKVEADGVSEIESLYSTYITGIGYRNPTAVVTGNISYEGGSPVKDVTIKANSEGSNGTIGSVLRIPSTEQVKIENLNSPITTAATIQAWIRPETNFTTSSDPSIQLFRLVNFGFNYFDANIDLDPSSNTLSVNIGGSEYQLQNFYPSGKLNTRGDDELLPITDFNTNFVHFSIVLNDGEVPLLYINGRAINDDYKNEINAQLDEFNEGYAGPYLEVSTPTQPSILSLGGVATEWDDVYIGSGKSVDVDEVRIWNAVVDPLSIRTDYRRYISGNDSRLISYLSANENVGAYAYDLSRNGFNYNKNHGVLWNASTAESDKVLWINGAGNIPTSDQLGILGVSDSNGNYEITAIPYSGTGESFTITPLYGQHQFEPNQQLVFLGQGSEVVNKIDFVDVSSFSFKGKVLFDSREVFRSFVDVNSIDPDVPDFSGLTDGDEYISGPGILDEGYNYYQKGSEKFSKGEYWYNDAGTSDDDTDDYLERYARIASEGVSIYIDGQIVLDENNTPLTSDVEGNFDISVPIGNHYITLKKNGHEFNYNGRFPADPGTFQEFFEDANEQVIFVDNTKVTLVGKVVGGAVEAQKPIGFGQDGLFETSSTDDDGIVTTTRISSKNNIGIANIVLDYAPVGANVTPYTKFYFETNSETGEYRTEALPLNYEINQTTGLKINTNTSINLLDANESVNISDVIDVTTPEYVYEDGSIEEGEPYHYEKSFTYRSVPVLRVTEQTSDEMVSIDDVDISTDGFEYPVYTQFGSYKIVLNSFERYINNDDAPVEDLVPVIDGELIINNNLALEGSTTVENDPQDASIINYTFKGGLPAISSPFIQTLDIKYRIKGVDYPAENYISNGIILGGQSDGSQTFITAAPDTPDIILRDPPGSNSFASIEEGESISFTSETDLASTIGESVNLELKLGVRFETGGGLAGPVIDAETTDNINAGIKLSRTSTNGESVTKKYTFTQTISTSDDPEFVGAEGDLYIGQSKNYFYGSYDDIQTSAAIIGTSPSYELTNTAGESIFVSKQKAMYFVEEPSETFFVYSQKYLLESLIPELELIISNLDNGIINEGDQGVLTRREYVEQIRLWRSIIQENEKLKYVVKNDRAAYKSIVTDRINDFNSTINEALEDSDLTPALENNLKDRLAASNNLKTLLDSNFEDNISFDAGVGEFSRSIETSTITSTTKKINLNIQEDLAIQFGFQFNSTGLISTTSFFFEQDINAAITEEEESTINVSYTFKDNDPANLLSVDVVNLFDGNGPVFSTIGGKTSCPYEGPELSNFYNHTTYDPDATEIVELSSDQQEQLSYATQKAEDPLISVEVADVSNVPEGQNAEFVLKLENRSDLTSDAADFNYFELLIDNTTNPNNALININANANIVYVPYGEPVYYTMTLGKSVSDVYDYKDIRVVLQSRCDPVNVFDDVYVSAQFIPSCSEVEINAPLDNWVYNIDTAYNLDGTTNSLNIDLFGFNTSFDSFQKIDLEYRLASSPNWSRLQTYYSNQTFYDEAVLANETDISLISSPTLSFGLDIAGLRLQDGEYEIRARSSCTNGTEFISEVITGSVDLHAPQRFGTPLPTDGILSSGEDLKVSFSESVFYNSAVSNIEIKGETNQLPINNNVSLYFEGVANTAVINNPRITSGDITVEFWMKNSTTSSTASIISQTDGINIGLENGEIYYTLNDLTTRGVISNDNLFHHYTFTHKNSTGEISIYEDDSEIAGNTDTPETQFTTNNELVVGGNTFIGNIHDLRIWSKAISLEDAYANRFTKLIGNENSLIGYWPMNEGRGTLAKDLARFKHATVNASWDIKPKGNSYQFQDGQSLEMDNVDFVVLNNEMDATISFWVKTDTPQVGTIFSNGRGDGSDIVQSNGLANKWAISMTTTGTLNLESEGNSYPLTTQSIADDSWHHVTLLFNRIGSLRTYIDAELVSSNPIADIGGFSGNKAWLGARGSIDLAGNETIDQPFLGKIDEFRFWNTLRNVEQISRDRFNEVDFESIGMLLYARMNTPETPTGNGPRYYHAYSNLTIIPSNAILSNGTVNYSDDVPGIRPERSLIKFQVNQVINEDEMILEPVISDWASLEGQIVDITVHRMFDASNNMQQSPITWTAYIKRNEVSWFAEGYNEIIDIVKNDDEEKSFEITVLNKGGNGQPFNISNVPNWLTLSTTSGTLDPDSSIVITATIDRELTAGEYLENLYLETDFGYDEKLQLEVRVLAPEPDWDVNPNDFEYSMNIVGKVKIDGVFSNDLYDKVAAFHEGEVRGVANLIYDPLYQEYFIYVTVYSETVSGESINFSIWDASDGKVLGASIDTNATISFKQNEVIGTLNNSAIFENTDIIVQEIEMNQGWTWVSLNVNDANFSNLNTLTENLSLETSDRILSHSPSLLETYYKDESVPTRSGWSGDITADGGLTISKMYKIRLAEEQALTIRGNIVDIDNWDFPVKENWNWLPYPIGANQPINEALAYFEAQEGDVIKSQSSFAIYDPLNGWKGTLNYLEAGNGYMMKSSLDQSFSYPTYLSTKAGKSKDYILNNGGNQDMMSEFKSYSQNMNAVVSLPEGYHELFVYDTKGILKGVALNQDVSNTQLSFITIYGDVPENLEFYIGDGFQKKPTAYTIPFKSNDVLGTITDPIILRELKDTVTIYPNPFNNDFIIQTNTVKSETIFIKLFNLTNQLIFSKKLEVTSGVNSLRISPEVASGIYLLQMEMNENTINRKIIKN
ncbi:LamG-like jellyroll fold domain-containing protein [uncultured Aquimarina sp.]|uniref:LamG-like jellyroll fold domain-containing protein n=1 Tax=uncultured Aquimarina sp. TaxID=575652 RepID=UPI00262357CD|nr:LamG-like jellyroll fold domain-containing protein [uncultured Aquimarina sp.]